MTMTKPPPGPRYLGPSAKFWREVVAEYELTPADLRLLEAACRSWDRAVEAGETIRAEGTYF